MLETTNYSCSFRGFDFTLQLPLRLVLNFLGVLW